ncbi:MAG TPA: 50S ribosomal protein L21 [Candidatus Saccharimonadales bacterium]|nr:50S ribosomal protein L21 [Candidatus Saccharimonadales bacterium]
MWAIIKTGGKQYKVEEGQIISVEKLDGEKDAKISFDQVLALGGDKVFLGTPTVDKAKVSAKIIETYKDKKIRVVKFKPKSKYTRTTGHRHQKTKVLIEKIIN